MAESGVLDPPESIALVEPEPVPASVPVQAPQAVRPQINPWIIALTVTLATFMELLDTSIANVRRLCTAARH